jgi:hypothetical protein
MKTLKIDSRFDFSDYDQKLEKVTFDTTEDLLAALNFLPRQIGFLISQLEAVEVAAADFLHPNTVDIKERTDNWLAERRNELKVELSDLKKQDDDLRAQRDEIDQEFMCRFETRGTRGTRTARFTISLKEDASYPEIVDRTEFEDYVLSTKKLHLLQKRLSLSAIQEELSVLHEQYEEYKSRLDNSINKETTAEDIYFELFGSEDSELLKNKISILRATSSLISTLEQDLKGHFSVPGVDIRTKQTINAVKVRS